MKRAIAILLSGVVIAAVAYACFYSGSIRQNREVMQHPTPELAWLKSEFQLSDEDYLRISKLHDAYLPTCMEMCRRIDAKNAEIKALLTKTNVITPEIEQKLAEASQVRLECQKKMLSHFYEVSRAMPPEQGKRYLAWVEKNTSLLDTGMMNRSHMDPAQ